MSWAFVQKANGTVIGESQFFAGFGGNVTAGNFVAFLISITGDSVTLSLNDGTNTITNAFTVSNGTACTSALYYIRNHSGGNPTCTIDSGGNLVDWFVEVAEFSGGNTTSPASGTPTTNSGLSGTASTGSMTPADNDVLLLADMATIVGDPTLTENAGSEGFTLLGENEVTANGARGSALYKILSGAPGTPSESWTISSSGEWAAGIAAFKPAAGGGGATITPPVGSGSVSGITAGPVRGSILTPQTP